MTNYWDKHFIEKIDCSVKNIFEVGARYGNETLNLHKIFPFANIYSFECNPNTIDICKKNLENITNIYFEGYGLGDKVCKMPFYSYVKNNDGASSFLKRIDYEETQVETGIIEINTIEEVMNKYKINYIDLLCMDVQGYEINVLKGANKRINNIKYIIMEEPKPIINETYLPKNVYSKYINAPSSIEIKKFMKDNNFREIVRLSENNIEDNVMYRNNNI